jgi:hypothetical protein
MSNILHPSTYHTDMQHWDSLVGNTISYSGLTLDVIKSALQKFIRRGLAQEAMIAAWEMLRFDQVHSTSNLLNRLMIIAVEDRGPSMFSFIVDLVNDTDRSTKHILDIVNTLAQGTGTRITCECLGVYAHAYGRKLATENGLLLDKEETSIKKCTMIFRKRLTEKDLRAFCWLYHYTSQAKHINLQPKYDGTKSRTRDPMIIIWHVLREFLEEYVYQSFVRAYFKVNERDRKYFISMGILAVCYNLKYEKMELVKVDDDVFNAITESQYVLKPPSYVYDIHTRIGKINGADRTFFNEEGSIITNLDSRYYQEKLHHVYNLREE